MTGLEQVIDYLTDLEFAGEDIRYLQSLGIFDKDFLDYLRNDWQFRCTVAAHHEGMSLYVAAPLLKFHSKSWIKIEERSPKEIWPEAPKKLKIINFAFDLIPAEWIAGIICEAGIIRPKN